MVRFIVSALTFLVLVLGLAAGAGGQTTRPAEATAGAVDQEALWPQTVAALAKALASGDKAALAILASPSVGVRRFGVPQPETLLSMGDRLAGSTLVGQHAYVHPPLVMAADVAADIKTSTIIPEKDKIRYLIEEESEMKRANATAVQWVVEQLEAKQGTLVGVIAVWTPRAAGEPGAASAGDLHFVLCRGEEIAPRQFKIAKIVYGQPLPETNQN